MTEPVAGSDTPARPAVPLVVQLGFAGARTLFDERAHPDVRPDDFHDALLVALKKLLQRLPSDLGLSDRHFLCGLSQLALGADTLFTCALRDLEWPQRFFLPESRENFLLGKRSDGTPEFGSNQRGVARALFDSTHAIQERVVSESASRHVRFQEVISEIVRASDVMVCLRGEIEPFKPGGTEEIIHEAHRRNRPLLRIDVAVGDDGQPHLTVAWERRELFAPPQLPRELDGLVGDITGIPPSMSAYCQVLKQFASGVSKFRRGVFRMAAFGIIGTHLFATVLALAALQLHEGFLLPLLLGGELLLLIVGFGTHRYLHRSHTVRVWAMARLVAEIARSAHALADIPGYFRHFFVLALPPSLRPLLRTLNVLHLRDTRVPERLLESRRDSYIEKRLLARDSGQIPYYEKKLKAATLWNRLTNWTFLGGSSLAILATLVKVLIVSGVWHILPDHHALVASLLGSLAVILPLFAVGALSLAASQDVEARVHTYRDMVKFLSVQRDQLIAVTSDTALSTLALETEAHLLGENVSWYSRRAFTSVS